MSAVLVVDDTITAIFSRHEPGLIAAPSHVDRFDRLLELHGDLARHAAEATWLQHSEALSAGSISLAEFWKRLEDRCCDVFRVARAIQLKYDYGSRSEQLRAMERIVGSFCARTDDLAASMPGGAA